MTAKSNIQEGIEEIKGGLLKLQESSNPYSSIGVLTAVLDKLVKELIMSFKHDYLDK